MFSPNQVKYLKIAFEEYQRTNNPSVTIKAKNLDDFYHLSEALQSLLDKELIVPMSDNFFKSTFNPITDKIFKFAITEKLVTLYQQQNQTEK